MYYVKLLINLTDHFFKNKVRVMDCWYIITSSFLITRLSKVNFLEIISALHKSLDAMGMLVGRSPCSLMESCSMACSDSSFFNEFGLETKESCSKTISSLVLDSSTVLAGIDFSSVINAVGVISKLPSGSISVRLSSSFIICTSGFAVGWLLQPDLFKLEVCSFGGENTNDVFALSKSLSESKKANIILILSKYFLYAFAFYLEKQ